MVDPLVIAMAAGAAILGGFSRGLLGFGGALILAPALVFVIEPVVMVPLIMLVDLPANIGLLKQVWRDWDRHIVTLIVIGTMIGLPAGIYLLGFIDPDILARMIYAMVALAALLLMSGWRYPGHLNRRVLLTAGVGNGVTLGATSIATGMVPVLYGGTATMAAARANMIVWMSISGPLIFIIASLMHGTTQGLFEAAILLAPLYLLGVFLGAKSFKRVNEAVFRKLVLWVLLAAGLLGLSA